MKKTVSAFLWLLIALSSIFNTLTAVALTPNEFSDHAETKRIGKNKKEINVYNYVRRLVIKDMVESENHNRLSSNSSLQVNTSLKAFRTAIEKGKQDYRIAWRSVRKAFTSTLEEIRKTLVAANSSIKTITPTEFVT